MSQPTLTIDGRTVSFEPGQTVLQAAEAAGIDIPNLCAYPTIKPFGRCRLCIVSIDGVRGYPSACTTPCTPDMVVVTETADLNALRRDALALVLTEHPTGCLMCGHQDDCIDHHGCHSRRSGAVTGCRFCPKDQQCELQSMVERLGVDTMDYPVKYRGLKVDHRDPFFDRDYNLCILCARCVRVCDERRGAQTISLTYRGPQAMVGTAYDRSLIDSGCQFCGECVDVCPTASLAERVNKWVGVPEQTTATTCGFCPLGCEVELRSLDNQIIGARPLGDALCSVGRFAPVETAVAEGRLVEPHIRKRGRLVPAEWDEALAMAVAGLKAAGRVKLFASGDLLDEDLDAIDALGRTMGVTPESDAAWQAPSGGLAEVSAAKRVVVIGAQLRYRQTPLLLAARQAAEAGAKLVVIDAWPSDLRRWASQVITPRPGEEAEAIANLAGQLSGRGPAAIVWDPLIVDAEVLEPVAALLGASLVPLNQAVNSRGVSRLGFEAWEDVVADALVSFGRPSGEAWASSGFRVVHTHWVDPSMADADVLLPATICGEEDGTIRDLGGRSRLFRAAVAPAGEARLPRDTAAALAAAWPNLAAAAPQPRPDTNGLAKPGPQLGRPAGGLLVLRETSGYQLRGHDLTVQVPGLIPLAKLGRLQLHDADALDLGLKVGDAVALMNGSSMPVAEAVVAIESDAAQGIARLVLPPSHGTIQGPNPNRLTIRRILPVAQPVATSRG